MDYDEKRQNRRMPYHRSCTLSSRYQDWKTPLWDVSNSGALIGCEEHWGLFAGDDDLTLTIPLDDNDEFVVRMKVRLIYVQDEKAGLECLHIDEESLSFLERLIEAHFDGEALTPSWKI